MMDLLIWGVTSYVAAGVALFLALWLRDWWHGEAMSPLYMVQHWRLVKTVVLGWPQVLRLVVHSAREGRGER